MRRCKQFIIAILVLGESLCGCAGAPDDVDAEAWQPPTGQLDIQDSAPEVPPGATAVSYRPFEELVGQFQTYSGLDARERLVISSQEEWVLLQSRLGRLNPPTEPLPDPDFGQEQLIVAAMGAQNSGGYRIHITGVWRSEGVRYVSVQEVSPAEDCGVIMVLTQPVDAVLTPRSDEPVLFVDHSAFFRCGCGP